MTIRDHRQPAPWRDRHPKEKPECRCCWVCGKVGGQGFTHALRFAGYRLRDGEMGYAHNNCMARAQKQHARRTTKAAS